MLNLTLINATVNLVLEMEAANYITETNTSIFNRTIAWYEYSDIVDIETLAAVVLTGEYPTNQKREWILEKKKEYFPEYFFDNVSVDEILLSIADDYWR